MATTESGRALIDQYNVKNQFANLLGLKLSVLDEGIAQYTVKIQGNHLATPGFVHGGLLTTLLDATMGAGALTLVADELKVVSTIEMNVNFIRAALEGEILIAQSSLVRKGKTVIFMRAEIKNEQNQMLAVSTGCFYPFDATKAGYII